MLGDTKTWRVESGLEHSARVKLQSVLSQLQDVGASLTTPNSWVSPSPCASIGAHISPSTSSVSSLSKNLFFQDVKMFLPPLHSFDKHTEKVGSTGHWEYGEAQKHTVPALRVSGWAGVEWIEKYVSLS